MMRGKAILKSFKETRNHDVLFEYGRLLEQQGWKCIPIEGGYLSPDGSTIFICMRTPYEGQLLQYSSGGEESYLSQVKAMVESGDFTE
ncbi:hypothetical protein [Lacrimispora amygdalina]|nr:hypothetical protein [Clostridium indicum]